MAVPLAVKSAGGPYHVIYRVGNDYMGFLTTGPALVRQVSSFAPPIRVGGDPAYSNETYQQHVIHGFNEGGDRLVYETGDRRYQWSDGKVALHRDDVITLSSMWESSDAAQTATAIEMLDFNGSLCPQPWIVYATGTTLRAFNTSTLVWADAHPAAGVFAQSIVHVAMSANALVISFISGNYYTWTGESLTTTFADGGSTSSKYILGTILGVAAWKSLASNLYKYVAAWSAAIPVGRSSTNITDLYEHQGLLFISKPEGVFTYDGTTVRRILAADQTLSTNNFRGLCEWLNALYLPWLNAIHKGVVSTSTNITNSDITPTMGGDTAKERYGHGKPIKIIAGPRKLYVALDDGEGLYPEVLSYDGMSYQQVYRGASGDTMNAFGYSRQMDWLLLNDGATRIKKVINTGDAEYPNFNTTGEFWTPALDGGFPGENKAYRSIEIETGGCLTDMEYITISYRLDGGSWVAVGVIETNGRTELVLDSMNGHVVGKKIEFKFVLTRTTGVTSTPIIKLPIIVRMMVLPEPIDAYTETIILKLSEMLANGEGQLSNAGYTIQQMLDFLNMARASSYPLLRTDEYGREYTVRISDKSERPERLTDGSYKYEVQVNMVDLAPGLNWQTSILASKLILTAVTTTANETVTLQRITPIIDVTVHWGDGSSSTISAANTGTTTHSYAVAGTYTITAMYPSNYTYLDLRDTRLTVNSAQIAKCTALVTLRDDCKGTFNSSDLTALPITSLYVDLPAGGTYTFSSSDISGLALTYARIELPVAGTYTFSTADIASMALTYLRLNLAQSGTYTFSTAHLSSMDLTNLVVNIPNTGTYNVASSDLAAMANLAELALYLSAPVGTYVIDTADLSATALTSLTLLLYSTGTFTIDSADIAALALTKLYLNLPVAGTYTFNTANIAAMALTELTLNMLSAGTYTFSSANIAAMPLTTLSINFDVAGTYTFNTANIAAMALTNLTVYLSVAGTYTFNSANIAAMSTITTIDVWLAAATNTIAKVDWDGFPACTLMNMASGLSQTQVDNILLGLYDGLATRTATLGDVNLSELSNAAPSGVLQAQCPPVTGKEAAYELVNDSCGVSTQHWSGVTLAS